MPKNPEKLQSRREMIANRVSNARHPSREIQRIADELYIDKSTVYRDLEAIQHDKKNGYRY